jgi:hypothetical protein
MTGWGLDAHPLIPIPTTVRPVTSSDIFPASLSLLFGMFVSVLNALQGVLFPAVVNRFIYVKPRASKEYYSAQDCPHAWRKKAK